MYVPIGGIEDGLLFSPAERHSSGRSSALPWSSYSSSRCERLSSCTNATWCLSTETRYSLSPRGTPLSGGSAYFEWQLVPSIISRMLGLWLVWLSGLSADLQTKGSPVRFPVRARAWVAGQVPSRGCMRGNHTLMFLSFPSPLSKNK